MMRQYKYDEYYKTVRWYRGGSWFNDTLYMLPNLSDNYATGPIKTSARLSFRIVYMA